MTIERDGRMDPDEVKLYYDLAACQSMELDLVMLVERSGTPVPCESLRVFSDGKPRMAIGGYYWQADVSRTEGRSAMLSVDALYVVRRSDASTASLANMLRNNDRNLRVKISAYRASGDKRTVDRDPTFEIEIDEARIVALALSTGGPWQAPSELIRFGYRNLIIRSAAQLETGQVGPQNECLIGD